MILFSSYFSAKVVRDPRRISNRAKRSTSLRLVVVYYVVRRFLVRNSNVVFVASRGVLRSSRKVVRKLLFQFRLHVNERVYSIASSRGFSTKMRDIRAQRQLLGGHVHVVRGSVSVSFFVFPSLVVSGLTVVVCRVRVFSFQGDSLLGGQVRAFVRVVGFSFYPKPLANANCKVTRGG